MYILCSGFKKIPIDNQKFNFLTKICEMQNKRENKKSFAYKQSTNFFAF